MTKPATTESDIEISQYSTGIFVVLCVTIGLAIAAYGAVDPFAQSILSILSFVLIALWAADSFQAGELRLSKNSIQVPLLALIVVGLVQLLPFGSNGDPSAILNVPATNALSLDPWATRMFTIRLVIFLVFLAACLTFLNNSGRIRRAVIFLVSFGTLLGFFGILQKLADPDAIYGLRLTPQALPFGPYVNQHHFAALMVMMSGPVIGFLVAGKVRRDLLPLLWIAAVMMAVAGFFTGSRGGMLSYAAMTGFALFAAGRYRTPETSDEERTIFSKVIPFAGAAVLGIVILGVAVLLGAGSNLIRGFGLTGGVDDISSGRLHFWQVALEIFAANPVLGAGLDGFGVAFPFFDTRNGAFRVEQAHNEYLQMLADGGIIGFACVTIFIFLLIRKGLSSIKEAGPSVDRGIRIGAMAGCIGVLVHSFFDFPLRTTANAFVFLMLATVAIQSVTAEVKSKKGSSGRSRSRSSSRTAE